MQTIKRLRIIHEMTQKDLSEKTFISRSQLCEIERGKAKGSLDTLAAIAKAFDLELWQLFWVHENSNDAMSVLVKLNEIKSLSKGRTKCKQS
jgi:transcriptional regulator with XRE-family HTH domain